MTGIKIRESEAGDLASIEALYPDAFPDEDLLPLVRELLKVELDALSLAGFIGSCLVGHIIFTPCGVAGSTNKAALLGPLVVTASRQRQGVGNAIVRAGVQRLESFGLTHVFVLGDPKYYRRFGFKPESRVAPPYRLPPEWASLGAWQSMSLGYAKSAYRGGKLSVPPPWLKPALWTS